MSRREIKQANELAALKAAHAAQIAALSDKSVPDTERLDRFAKAAGIEGEAYDRMVGEYRWMAEFACINDPVIQAAWTDGDAPLSLFALHPMECLCPVHFVKEGKKSADGASLEGIPSDEGEIKPEHLPIFARVQQQWHVGGTR